ncbi:hypothetical protein D3C76_1167760 [compost metagenome]
MTAAGFERLVKRGTTGPRIGNSDRINTVGPVGSVVHCQARTALVGRGGGSCVTQWSIGIGNGHGVFLLVQIATSNVHTHITAAAVGGSTHHGRIGHAKVVDAIIVADLCDVRSGSGRTEHKAVIDRGVVGGCVGDGSGVVLLVAGTCRHVDADVAACACGRTAHLGRVFYPFIPDAVAGTALSIARVGSRADGDHPCRRGLLLTTVVMVVATPIVLPSLYSNSHDRSNCENQRL